MRSRWLPASILGADVRIREYLAIGGEQGELEESGGRHQDPVGRVFVEVARKRICPAHLSMSQSSSLVPWTMSPRIRMRPR